MVDVVGPYAEEVRDHVLPCQSRHFLRPQQSLPRELQALNVAQDDFDGVVEPEIVRLGETRGAAPMEQQDVHAVPAQAPNPEGKVTGVYVKVEQPPILRRHPLLRGGLQG